MSMENNDPGRSEQRHGANGSHSNIVSAVGNADGLQFNGTAEHSQPPGNGAEAGGHAGTGNNAGTGRKRRAEGEPKGDSAKLAAAQRMLTLFAGSENHHGTHREPTWDAAKNKWGLKPGAKTDPGPATLELWQQHLTGKRPLGVIPIRTDGTVVWACIDVDEYETDVMAVVISVDNQKLPLVPARSKSGGLHLFRFYPEPVTASAAIDELRALRDRLGLPTGTEIFPKQTSRGEGDAGSWIVMPYFGGDFGGKLREQVGLKKTGSAMTVEEFIAAAKAVQKVPLDASSKAGKAKPQEDTGAPFGDGPPCLQAAAAAGVTANRNITLFNMGVFARKKYPTDWKSHVEQYNHDYMKPPLAHDEVAEVVKNLRKKDYAYQCRCEGREAACQAQPFGKGRPPSYPEFECPVITRAGDETRWSFYVEGQLLNLSSTEVLNQKAVIDRCFAACGKQWVPLSRVDWSHLLDRLYAEAEKRDEPTLSKDEQFLELLEDFLTNRLKGTSSDDLHLGRPWENDDKQRHEFRIKDLELFISTHGTTALRMESRQQVGTRLRALGGDVHVMDVRGKKLRVWWVPTAAIQKMPDVPAPPFKEPPV